MPQITDLVVAFIMQCDSESLTYEEGIGMAEALGDEVLMAAEDRISYAEREEAP